MSSTAHRDCLIGTAHTYAFVPEWHTVLVKVDDKRAVRMLADDASAIARTADFVSTVRRTVHRGRPLETVVRDYRWADGMRIRMTETFAL